MTIAMSSAKAFSMNKNQEAPRDKLILLKPEFPDPQFPGRSFYCWHCAMVEGVLAASPHLTANLDIERVDWPRPRESVVALVGPENQSLPLLILAKGTNSKLQTGTYGDLVFINDKFQILAALHERHGFPEPHP